MLALYWTRCDAGDGFVKPYPIDCPQDQASVQSKRSGDDRTSLLCAVDVHAIFSRPNRNGQTVFVALGRIRKRLRNAIDDPLGNGETGERIEREAR